MDQLISRPLNSGEKSMLGRLLSPEFPGAEELRKQVSGSRAIDTNQPGTIRLLCDESVEAAKVVFARPVEGRCLVDGVPIEAELFIADGRLSLMGFVFHAEKDLDFIELDPDLFSVYVADGSGNFSLSLKGTAPAWGSEWDPTA